MPHQGLSEASLFESAFRDAAIGMALVALDGRWLQVNDALCSIVGYTRDELLASDFQAITHPEDLQSDLTQLRRLFEGEIPSYHLEKRYLHKAGHVVFILLTVSVVHTEAGRPAYFIAQIQDVSAHKLAEQRASAFFEHSRELLAIAGPSGMLEQVNQAWVDLLGWSREELTSRPLLDFVHPDDRESTRTEAERVDAGESRPGFRNRYRARDGSYRWLEWSTTRMPGGELLCAVRDVTAQVAEEQAKVEREQRRARELLFELGESIKNLERVDELMHVVCKFLWTQFEATDCMYGELSTDQSTILARAGVTAGGPLFPDVPLTALSPLTVHDMKRGRTVIVENTQTDPRTRALYGSHYGALGLEAYVALPLMREERWVGSLFLRFERPRAFSAEDISLLAAAADRVWARAEHTRMLVALRASEAQYRRIVENTHEGIWEADEYGVLRYVNRQMAAMIGYQPDEMIGKPAVNFLDADAGEATQVRLLRRQQGLSEAYDFRFTRRDGSTLWARVETSPLLDPKGRYAGAVVLVADISERRAAEEALRSLNLQLEQRVTERTRELRASLQEKEVLLQEIHHRVKNNLQVVCSLLSLQAMQVSNPELVDILNSCQGRVRSIALVHERLYASKSLADVRFEEYVRPLAKDLSNTYGASLRGVACRVHPSGIRLPTDVAVVCGLLINELVSNALKHAFPGDTGGTIDIALTRWGDTLRLSVRDDGVGMPARPESSKPGSLGLELIQTFAEQLEATIDVRVSGGTEFVLTFKDPLEGDE